MTRGVKAAKRALKAVRSAPPPMSPEDFTKKLCEAMKLLAGSKTLRKAGFE